MSLPVFFFLSKRHRLTYSCAPFSDVGEYLRDEVRDRNQLSFLCDSAAKSFCLCSSGHALLDRACAAPFICDSVWPSSVCNVLLYYFIASSPPYALRSPLPQKGVAIPRGVIGAKPNTTVRLSRPISNENEVGSGEVGSLQRDSVDRGRTRTSLRTGIFPYGA